MDTTDRRPIIAATDFSHDGNAAVRYASDLAERSHRSLAVVHVAPVPTAVGPTVVSGAVIRGRLRRAHVGVADLVEAVTRDHPGLPVTASIAVGDPVDILLNRSASAFALIIGARGLGGHPALRWGSVSNRVVSRARCPVLIVRADDHENPPRATGPVVIAGDTTAAGEAGTAFATSVLRPGPSYVITVHPGAAARDVDLSGGGLPADRMIIRVATGPAGAANATARVAAEYGAGLVVVARNRHSWPFRFGAGSTVQTLVGMLDCPLAVVETVAPAPRPSPVLRPATVGA